MSVRIWRLAPRHRMTDVKADTIVQEMPTSMRVTSVVSPTCLFSVPHHLPDFTPDYTFYTLIYLSSLCLEAPSVSFERGDMISYYVEKTARTAFFCCS